MKKFKLLLTILSSLLSISFMPSENKKAKKTFDGKGYDSSVMMDFTPSSDEEISSYYGDISSLVGDELKDYLYSKISTHFIDGNNDSEDLKYYQAYGTSGVTKWYKITDRNWSLSRSITPSTYLFSEDSGNNYYETMLYFEDNTTESKQINTDINNFTGEVGLDHIDWTNKKAPKASGIYGNNKAQVDKEHVWVKSHGFSPSGDPSKGAGTDLHHLIAADHNTNNVHNDMCYGEVADHNLSSTTIVYCIYGDGSYDISGWKGKSISNEDVFEPTDSWKGNIARALLYMATRYSKKLTSSQTNSEYEPYLHFETYSATESSHSKDNNEGIFHNLSTFLSWNELDPVDEYEKKRNDLIYKNVQDNRNPYVDHPEWARRVFDSNYSLDDNNDNKDNNSSSTNDSSVKTDITSSSKENTSKSSSTTEENQSAIDLIDKIGYPKLIIGGVVVIVILIIVIIIFSKHGKKKPKKRKNKKK